MLRANALSKYFAEENVRNAIDSAVGTVDHALRALSTLNTTVTMGEADRNNWRVLLDQPTIRQDARDEAYESLKGATHKIFQESQAVFDAQEELLAQGVRLKLRLGIHPIVEGLAALESVYGRRHDALAAAVTGPLSEEDQQIIEQTNPEMSAAVDRFFNLCEQWFSDHQG